MKFLSFVFFAASLPLLTASALDLHPLFTNHAVLQQDMPVPVWGTAKAGEIVTVEFSGQKVSAKANENGDWMVVLAPLSMNASPSVLKASSPADSLSVEGLLVGEVWVASGQSNMAMSVGRTFDAESVAQAAGSGAYSNLRLFRTPVEGSDSRASTVETQWCLPTAPEVDRFSAVAFFFGAKLAQDRSVPVGLIQAANGGTNAYSWINSETLESDPAAQAVRSYWAAALKNLPESMERYKTALAKFRTRAKAAKEKGEECEFPSLISEAVSSREMESRSATSKSPVPIRNSFPPA
jgi:sialate O-acetylesterase